MSSSVETNRNVLQILGDKRARDLLGPVNTLEISTVTVAPSFGTTVQTEKTEKTVNSVFSGTNVRTDPSTWTVRDKIQGIFNKTQ